MIGEERKLYRQWLEENGGEEGALYKTFPDEELEKIFISAFRMRIKNEED